MKSTLPEGTLQLLGLPSFPPSLPPLPRFLPPVFLSLGRRWGSEEEGRKEPAAVPSRLTFVVLCTCVSILIFGCSNRIAFPLEAPWSGTGPRRLIFQKALQRMEKTGGAPPSPLWLATGLLCPKSGVGGRIFHGTTGSVFPGPEPSRPQEPVALGANIMAVPTSGSLFLLFPPSRN